MKRPLRIRWMEAWNQPRCRARVQAGIVRYAPKDEVRFVEGPEAQEEVLIADIFCSADFSRVPPGKKVVYFLHGPSALCDRPYLRQALLSVSFMNTPDEVRAPEISFLRIPLGVDGDVFYRRTSSIFPYDVPSVVMTTGYDVELEAIRDCMEAAKIARQAQGFRSAIHVGPPFDFGCNPLIRRDIYDEEMAQCYSSVLYVSGLRRGGGFELPVVEGLACGARPVCFDQPWYRHWFDGHAVFIPEKPNVTAELVKVFSRDPKPVTEDERREVLRKFSWKSIAGQFWGRVLGLTAPE
jgi:glycosyltransferase involved in cell wall biosynthesis